MPQFPASAVLTERGWLRPERAICYSNPTLLFHDVFCSRPGDLLSLAELAGYEKTGRRLLAIASSQRWSTIEPLEWLNPETLAFSTGEDIRFHRAINGGGALEQAETLERAAAGADHYLIFQRC